MAKFKITSPDGRQFVVTAPDGADESEVLAYAQQQVSGKKDYMALSDQEYVDPTAEMSGADKFLAGAGKAFTDIGRGAGQLIGVVTQDEVDAAKELDAPLMKTGAGVAGNIAGNISAFAPAALIPGANTITGGAALGGLFGALQPVGTGDSRAQNAVVGVAAGGALPTAVRTYRASKALVEPLYEGGRKNIAGRALRRAAGDDLETVASRLERPEAFVSGSRPTVGEVADNANIAALQRTVSAKDPAAYAARAELNNAARLRALDEVGGDVGAATEARRASTSGLLTSVTRSDALANPGPVAALIQKIINANPRREQLVSTLSRVKDTLADSTGKFSPQNLRAMISASRNIGDIISAKGPTGAKINEAIVRELSVVKKSLDRAIAKAEPAYGRYMSAYRQGSVPIDRAKTVGELKKASVSASEDTLGNPTLQAGKFAKNVRDIKDVARRATGFRRADPDRIFSPQQKQVLQNIKRDVARFQRSQNLGRGPGSDSFQKLSTANVLEQAGVPTLLRSALQVPGNLAGRLGSTLYGEADDQMSRYLAQLLLNPEDAAAIMRQIPPGERRAIARLLTHAQAAPVGLSQSGN